MRHQNMKMIVFLSFIGFWIQTLPVAVQSVSFAQEAKRTFTAEDAKKLIPAATSISNADFQKIVTSPGFPEFKSESLSVLLMILKFDDAEENPDASANFKYLVEGPPDPVDIAKAMWRSKSKGYATFIQPDFITRCTCEGMGPVATGKVEFVSKNLYSGSAEFTAKKNKEGWRITEFRLPGYEIKTVLGENGKWKKMPLTDDDN